MISARLWSSLCRCPASRLSGELKGEDKMKLTFRFTLLQRKVLHLLVPKLGTDRNFNIELATGISYGTLVQQAIEIIESDAASFGHRASAADLFYQWVALDKSPDLYDSLYEACAIPHTITFMGLTYGTPVIPPEFGESDDMDVSDIYLHIVMMWRIVLETAREIGMESFVRGKNCPSAWIVSLAMWGSFCPHEDLGMSWTQGTLS